MTEIEFSWLAGILEGEGSFIKGPKSMPNQPAISIQMTDEDIIQRVAKMFGTSYCRSDRGLDKGWKPAYRTMLRGEPAVLLMQILYPLMGKRRQNQISDAIKSYKYLGARKLTKQLVQQIKSSTITNMSELSRKFGVSRQQITRILNGKAWKLREHPFL